MMRVAAILLTTLVGCGSSSSEPAATPADTGVDPFATAGANNTFGDRDDACARVIAALNKRAGEVGCTLTNSKCPDMVDELEKRAGVAGQCMEYDLGTVANCEARIAAYASCADFASKPCQLGLRPSATNTCAAADAASEGG